MPVALATVWHLDLAVFRGQTLTGLMELRPRNCALLWLTSFLLCKHLDLVRLHKTLVVEAPDVQFFFTGRWKLEKPQLGQFQRVDGSWMAGMA